MNHGIGAGTGGAAGRKRAEARHARRPARRPCLALCFALALALGTRPNAAAMHEKGHLTVSFGGFFSHAFFYEAGTETYGELTGDYASDTSDLKDYTDVGVTLFLSVGYFLIDGWELGVQGSGMATWYPDGNQSDLAIYDVGGYTKVFFDNASAFTPYVGFKGGANWLGMDDYAEHDTTLGGLAGLEVYGTGPYSFFLEWTSVVTLNGGDSVGTEWRNQLYVGITWYWNLFPKPEPAE